MILQRLLAAVSLLCLISYLHTARAAAAQDVTVVEITDQALVKDCVPFGINLHLDSYWCAPFTKLRARNSYEGTTYRQCLTGFIQEEKGMAVWSATPEAWRAIHIGASFTILNGPAKGKSGIIKDITTRTFEHAGKQKEFTYYVFDRAVPAAPRTLRLPGMLVERFELDEGSVNAPSAHWAPNCGLKDKTPRVDVHIGDVRPGSTGRAALHMIAPDPGKPVHTHFPTMYPRSGQVSGPWTFEFWAKAKAGSPKIELLILGVPDSQKQVVEPTEQWQKVTLHFDVRDAPDPKDWTDPKSDPGMMWWRLRAMGGEVLVDDVAAWMTDEKNPTPFRDDLIAVLRELNPGSLRYIQMGGNTVDNMLTPARYSHRFTSKISTKPGPYALCNMTEIARYSLPEFYELCEYIGADPWYCLPGTLHKEELVNFMEFIGAPPTAATANCAPSWDIQSRGPRCFVPSTSSSATKHGTTAPITTAADSTGRSTGRI